ncbi:type VI secretion system-associated FHA domain protein TagH [Methylocella sp.]|uniref:type VI secretion system-associated FHA domain protein TagH n=1 Tax=Methylocella sp. TaxID=1978226 RepID=UPI00378309BC
MTLILTIENEQSLPNGAPTCVRLTDGRGVDIGRSANVDWPLPDPTRFISGRHCEVRFREGAYWLNDISTNGTFVNDGARRVQAPYLLRHGDRLAIGSYVIAVAIEETKADAPAPPEPEVAREAPATAGTDETTRGLEEAASVAAPAATPAAAPEEIARARAAAALSGRPFTVIRPLGPFPQPAAPRPNEEAALWAASSSSAGAAPDLWSLEAEPEPAEPAPVESHEIAPPAAAEDAAPIIEARAPDEEPAAPAPGREAQPEPRAQDESAAPAEAQEKLAPERSALEAPASGGPSAEDFLRAFAKGAGIPDHIFARKDPIKAAEELGALTRLAVEDLTQLLSARFKAKRFARASSQTMIQALDNNPLKFAPTTDDALKIMFGPRTSGYLDARRAFEGAFSDLKAHQLYTFAAMQQAVRMLVEDLDPKSIEAAAGDEGRLAALFGGRKGRLWDLFLARWQAKSLRHEDGLVDAFMLYFAECYDQAKDGA